MERELHVGRSHCDANCPPQPNFRVSISVQPYLLRCALIGTFLQCTVFECVCVSERERGREGGREGGRDSVCVYGVVGCIGCGFG